MSYLCGYVIVSLVLCLVIVVGVFLVGVLGKVIGVGEVIFDNRNEDCSV